MKNFTLIAGPCAIEDQHMGLKIAREVKAICDELSIDYIFKASYKKANRSKNNSFTAIGDDNALQIIQSIGSELNVNTITDIHESHEPKKVAIVLSASEVTIIKHLADGSSVCKGEVLKMMPDCVKSE